ncbi:flagellar basal body rod protein FlgB [Saliterribacillus persicus]|uniref:Flagellar basal body rod protein FlgB n=1 Tax=Saliterribacillus persicus TaxID=930114 RepID=A0A368XRY5_9BACI|nr:flagellar basal body rod protein FlgB [Saliterribacillus persicus]RCW70723.1 flagellar basal-body rod protein FlgB [Saliterribacillus persicus]
MSFFGSTIQNLEKSLDFATVKNNTIAQNIANADTTNYKSKNVVFKDVLKNELEDTFETKRTDPRHLSFSNLDRSQSFRITQNNSTMYNHNGNNVDIDKEMTDLAKNQIYYQALVDRINGKFSSLQSVLRGGN